MMRILHLTLKKKWFDMIASGEKKEEYRELKNYWYNRLMYFDIFSRNNDTTYRSYIDFKCFDIVRFKNGYAKDAPTIDVRIEDIVIERGQETWGAEPGKEYFVIKLGEILNPSPVGRG